MSDKNTSLISVDNNINIIDPYMNLIQVAVESGVELAHLEKLMDLQDRHEQKMARKNFYNAFSMFQSELPEIRKTGKVGYETNDGGFVGYKHSTLEEIGKAIAPVLSKHGLSYRFMQLPRTEPKDQTITLVCILTHMDGHSESTQMSGIADTSGKKNAIQAIASTRTYMQRYTLTDILGLTFTEPDDDGKGGGDFEPQQPQVEMCSDEKFNKNFEKWAERIQTGSSSAEEILATVQSKNSNLTAEQWTKLKAVGVQK